MSLVFDIRAIDEFLNFAKEAAITPAKDYSKLKDTKRLEIDLWHHWNNNGRKPEHLKPLYESCKPILLAQAKKWKGVELPVSTINAEYRKHFVQAVKTYDPKKGAQLSSWITSSLKKSSRFMKSYQNLGNIPEGQIAKIREYKAGKEYLTDLRGHEPDTKTLADHLKWSHKHVIQLQKELRADKPVSGWAHDPAEVFSSKELEAIHLLQYDTRMSAEERTVYEHTFGINGKPLLKPGHISKQTGIHPSKISRIRSKLSGYIKEAINVL